MKTNTQIHHDWALCSGFSPQPHLWPRMCFLFLRPCWIWAPAENLWELRQVSCPRGSFLLPKVPSTTGRLLLRLSNTCSLPLCFTTFSKGDTNCMNAFRSMYISTDLHISWLVSMWASKGISKSFQSQPTLAITLPKGSLSSRGEDPVSDRHSLSRPSCSIERMAHLSVTRSPKSSIWSPCSLALLTSAEISLSLHPLWLPRWFRVSRLLFLPAPSQLSFRCSPNFCCVQKPSVLSLTKYCSSTHFKTYLRRKIYTRWVILILKRLWGSSSSGVKVWPLTFWDGLYSVWKVCFSLNKSTSSSQKRRENLVILANTYIMMMKCQVLFWTFYMQ